MKYDIKANWSGSYPNLCSSVWKITINEVALGGLGTLIWKHLVSTKVGTLKIGARSLKVMETVWTLMSGKKTCLTT